MTAGATDRALGGAGCAWVPIWLRSELWGRVHVLQHDHELDDVDLMAIDRAAAALSLALMPDRDARPASDQARSALMRCQHTPGHRSRRYCAVA